MARILLAIAIAAVVGASSVGTAAADAPPQQDEKCDDLQTRCLHRENGICQIWHDECLSHHHVTHGPHRSRKLTIGHKRHV